PDWDTEELYLLARKNFNISALDFFAETLRTLATLRPKVWFRTVIRILLLDSRYCQAKWGFYGLPMNFNGPCDGNGTSMVCGYDSGVGKLYRQFSDEQNLVWESSTALYPSIYLPPGRTVDENAAYVHSVIKETVRKAEDRIPVYGFHWNYYHGGKSLLNMDDLKSGLVGPYDAGAKGVVIWGSSSERALPEFLDYVRDHMGPLARNFTEQMCKCSQTYCHGHGRCMPSSSTNCQCYPGYSGPSCEKADPKRLHVNSN
ncbi:Hyaluronidase-3, partial [Geodia barretti]